MLLYLCGGAIPYPFPIAPSQLNTTTAAQLALQTLVALPDAELVLDFYGYCPDILSDLENSTWEELVQSVKDYREEFPDDV